MKRYKVKLINRAEREYAMATAWWRTNRRSAPNLLRDELRAVRALLAQNPEAGRLDDDQGTDVRRVPLPATRYIVFYRIEHDKAEVHITALWHANREAPVL